MGRSRVTAIDMLTRLDPVRIKFLVPARVEIPRELRIRSRGYFQPESLY